MVETAYDKKVKSADELWAIYQEASGYDKEIYAEMRSNLLLVSGDHFQRKGQQFWNRIRQSRDLSEMQKLRLTKNHTHKIVRYYRDQISGYAPGVMVGPKNETELQDKKSAELNQSVWLDAKDRYQLREQVRQEINDFVTIGEVGCKIFWDPYAGKFLGYEPQMDEMTGEYIVDEMGMAVADKSRPVFQGDFVFERLYPFNLFREPGAKTMEESAFIGIRKMVPTKLLKSKYQDNPDIGRIEDTTHEEYIIFDSGRGEYNRTKNHSITLEWYFKPCHEYPNGYFYLTTQNATLEEGVLPGDIFPIVWQSFDEFPTHPRGRSILKVARPFQAEINRASSQLATHQITLGDDKVLYQSGTKLSPGALLPGVRGISYQGVQPLIMPGREGGQFIPYIEKQISEMYDAIGMEELGQEKGLTKDPMTFLFKSMKQMQRFSHYGEKFEEYQVKKCRLYLKLAKFYLPDDWLVKAIGTNEVVNMPEFRSTTELDFQIKLEPRNDTIETQFGKQMTIQHILQYVGKDMDKDAVGKLIKNLPFANLEESFSDLTLNYDVAQNIMLAIERGEQPYVPPYGDYKYILDRLTHRVTQPGFRILAPEVQQAYDQTIMFLETMLAEQAKKLQDAKNEFIPVGGAMVAADFYVENPKNPEAAAKRARFPYQALEWLKTRLESQGMALDRLEDSNKQVLADVAEMLVQKRPGAAVSPMPMPPNITDGGATYGYGTS